MERLESRLYYARKRKEFWRSPLRTKTPFDDADVRRWRLCNIRNQRGSVKPPHMTQPPTDSYEWRYEHTGDRYRLQSWHNGANRMQYGRIDERPEWLVTVVEVAAVAGATNRTFEPPPDVILWFRTDHNHNLTEFINI